MWTSKLHTFIAAEIKASAMTFFLTDTIKRMHKNVWSNLLVLTIVWYQNSLALSVDERTMGYYELSIARIICLVLNRQETWWGRAEHERHECKEKFISTNQTPVQRDANATRPTFPIDWISTVAPWISDILLKLSNILQHCAINIGNRPPAKSNLPKWNLSHGLLWFSRIYDLWYWFNGHRIARPSPPCFDTICRQRGERGRLVFNKPEMV